LRAAIGVKKQKTPATTSTHCLLGQNALKDAEKKKKEKEIQKNKKLWILLSKRRLSKGNWGGVKRRKITYAIPEPSIS